MGFREARVDAQGLPIGRGRILKLALEQKCIANPDQGLGVGRTDLDRAAVTLDRLIGALLGEKGIPEALVDRPESAREHAGDRRRDLDGRGPRTLIHEAVKTLSDHVARIDLKGAINLAFGLTQRLTI